MLKKIFNKVCPPNLHPSALAQRKFSRVTQGRVMAGPFTGTCYVTQSIGSAYAPKLLGTYEKELQPVVERLCRCSFDLIVDVGAAEGYYAIGMALCCPQAQVVAFESEARGRELITQMAQLNSVAERIIVKGVCDPPALKQTLGATSECLIIMDVEGDELSLLQPELIPELERCVILVELHDFIHPGLSEVIRSRFQDTHHIETIQQSGRNMNDLPFRSLFLDRWLIRLTDEQRPAVMSWFYMKPLNRSASI
jgi:hypothetical protein